MALYGFLLSCFLAFVAGHMVNYSIIFLALEWFDSHALAGIGYGLCFGPPLILGWFAGVYCDRYSPRKVLLLGQNSFFIAIGLLYFALVSAFEYRETLLLLAALFSGIGWSFVAPARFSALPFYVTAKKLATASIVLNLMVMAGFGLAPMLLKQLQVNFGWMSVLITATSLFALSSLILLPLGFTFVAKPAEKTWQEIKASLVFVKKSNFIKSLLLLSMIAYLLMGPMQVLLPSIAEHNLQLNEIEQGYYLSLIALSLIVGGLLAMGLKNNGKVGISIMLAIIIAGLSIGYLGVERQLTLSILVLVIASVCGGIAISFIVAGLQAFTLDVHRGRVMSFYSIISQVIPAISGAVAGLLAQQYSPSIALKIIAAVIVLSVTFCFIRSNNLRQLKSFNHD